MTGKWRAQPTLRGKAVSLFRMDGKNNVPEDEGGETWLTRADC